MSEPEVKKDVDETEMIDTDIEEVDLLEEEENFGQKIKAVKQKLKSCNAEKLQLMEDLQRTKADFLNSRRRLEEGKELEIQRATDAFTKNLLPLCDSFTMAMADKEAWAKIDENWRKGVEGIYNQLLQLLKLYQISTIDPLGQEFDPNKHEALGTEASDEETDRVIKVVQLGYERNNVIIRPAKVIISN